MKQKNKITLIIMLLAATGMLMQSCGKDNLKYPSSTLSGRFTYQGQPVGLIPSNPDIIGSANTATLLLTQVSGAQDKYGAGEVRIYAKQDGSFSSKFFNGEYKARTQTSKSPFEDFTNKPVTVNGDTDLGNIEVVPYWWMTGLTTTSTGGVFTANFNLTRPSTLGKTLQYVAVYLSPTNVTDIQSATQGAARTFNAGTNSGGNVVPAAASTGGAVTVKVDLNTLTTGEKQFLRAFGNNSTIFATIAVKTTNINDALYSQTIKLQMP